MTCNPLTRVKTMVVLFLLIMITSANVPSVCESASPLRVVILPVFDDSRMAGKDSIRVIDNALALKFHMPLETIVHFYDIVPTGEVKALLPQPVKRGGLKPDRTMLAQVAEKAKADVVIGVEITAYTARTYTSFWEGDLMQETEIHLRLVGYSTEDGKFLELRDHEYYHGDWSVMGDPETLTRKIVDRLLEKVPYTYKSSGNPSGIGRQGRAE